MNISYIRSGDYFIPDLKLPEETRPIGRWGRMHRNYLKEQDTREKQNFRKRMSDCHRLLLLCKVHIPIHCLITKKIFPCYFISLLYFVGSVYPLAENSSCMQFYESRSNTVSRLPYRSLTLHPQC